MLPYLLLVLILALLANSDINASMHKAAVFALADAVSADELCSEFILPDPLDKKTAAAVAKAVAEAAVKSGVARI